VSFDAESRLQVEWRFFRSTQPAPQAYNNRASIKTIFWQAIFTGWIAKWDTLIASLTKFFDIPQACGAGVRIKPGVKLKAEPQVGFGSPSSP
jgi:hypothetical protein